MNHMEENVSWAPWNTPKGKPEPETSNCYWCGEKNITDDMMKVSDNSGMHYMCIGCVISENS